jgi:hypothetical protein
MGAFRFQLELGTDHTGMVGVVHTYTRKEAVFLATAQERQARESGGLSSRARWAIAIAGVVAIAVAVMLIVIHTGGGGSGGPGGGY